MKGTVAIVMAVAALICLRLAPSAQASASLKVEGTHTYNSPGWTNSTDVILTYSCDPKPDQKRMSNDGSSWSDWEAYQRSLDGNNLRPWTIGNSEGSHTVYMQFRGGNLSDVVKVHKSIKLDTTKPTQSAHMTKTSYPQTAYPVVKFESSDNMSPKDYSYIVVKNSKGKIVGDRGAGWKTVGKWFSIKLLSNKLSNNFHFGRGTYKAIVHCVDKAGNEASTVTLKFKIT